MSNRRKSTTEADDVWLGQQIENLLWYGEPRETRSTGAMAVLADMLGTEDEYMEARCATQAALGRTVRKLAYGGRKKRGRPRQTLKYELIVGLQRQGKNMRQISDYLTRRGFPNSTPDNCRKLLAVWKNRKESL